VKIKIRLSDLLREHNLLPDKQGLKTELAEALGCGIRLINGLLNGKPKSVRLDILEKLVNWLILQGVPPADLPGALFGSDDLWDVISRNARRVEIYLGETPWPGAHHSAGNMVAGPDVEVATGIAQQLGLKLNRPISMDFNYIHFKYSNTGAIDADDRASAIGHFEKMRERQVEKPGSVAWFVGSQRKNLMVELLVASCFNCQAFTPIHGSYAVPFYLMYREGAPNLPSCFGGRAAPKVEGVKPAAGIYFRTTEGWKHSPIDEAKKTDAGIVIITFQAATHAMEVALAGFSSVGTLAVGRYFLKNAHMFWPLTATLGGRMVGVYICQLSRNHLNADPSCSVIPLSKDILENQSNEK